MVPEKLLLLPPEAARAVRFGIPEKVKLLAYDAEPQDVPVRRMRVGAQITLPSLHLWTIIVLK